MTIKEFFNKIIKAVKRNMLLLSVSGKFKKQKNAESETNSSQQDKDGKEKKQPNRWWKKINLKNMKTIFTKKDFVKRMQILILTGITPTVENLNKILLLNETENQRTYLLKDENEFYIINDNKGSLKIALRRTIERLKFIIYENYANYLIKLEGVSPEVKASKIVFTDKEDLQNKINAL